MARSMFASKLVRLAMVPILAAAVGLGTALVAQTHNDHKSPQADQGANFHFRDQDKQQFQSHYKSDINRYKANPGNRMRFSRGERAPSNVHFQPVPSSYREGVPPPPAGYQYGYSNGYVVAYNPTTRVIGDVIDLVDAAAH